MRDRILIICLFAFSVACVFAKEACCNSDPLDVGGIIAKITEKGEKLDSFTSNIIYSLTEDPEIFETTTIYTGTFRYLKTEKRQYAMIDFVTRQEDELPIEDYHQRYLFDGVWLTRVDYQLKQVNRDQLAPEDEPEDVFELISKDFPLMGFSGADKLSDSYDIKLEQSDDAFAYKLRLEPKEDAEVKYSDIEFVIDKRNFLPQTITSTSVSDDSICNIELDGGEVNSKLDEKIFKLDIPEDFTVSENKL